MTKFLHTIAGETVVEEIHPDLAPYYLVQPGYAELVTADDALEAVEDLKGAELQEAAADAGLPSSLTADETRQALADDLVNAPAGPDGVIVTAHPEPVDPAPETPARGRGRVTK